MCASTSPCSFLETMFFVFPVLPFMMISAPPAGFLQQTMVLRRQSYVANVSPVGDSLGLGIRQSPALDAVDRRQFAPGGILFVGGPRQGCGEENKGG